MRSTLDCNLCLSIETGVEKLSLLGITSQFSLGSITNSVVSIPKEEIESACKLIEMLLEKSRRVKRKGEYIPFLEKIRTAVIEDLPQCFSDTFVKETIIKTWSEYLFVFQSKLQAETINRICSNAEISLFERYALQNHFFVDTHTSAYAKNDEVKYWIFYQVGGTIFEQNEKETFLEAKYYLEVLDQLLKEIKFIRKTITGIIDDQKCCFEQDFFKEWLGTADNSYCKTKESFAVTSLLPAVLTELYFFKENGLQVKRCKKCGKIFAELESGIGFCAEHRPETKAEKLEVGRDIRNQQLKSQRDNDIDAFLQLKIDAYQKWIKRQEDWLEENKVKEEVIIESKTELTTFYGIWIEKCLKEKQFYEKLSFNKKTPEEQRRDYELMFELPSKRNRGPVFHELHYPNSIKD